jgi:hypothetical protein
MQNSTFRNKVTWYSFFFSLLVVWIHAYNAELFLGSGAETSFAGMAENFLGERIGQIAVPGFFMISGYLFFIDFEWGKLRSKWTRRIYSVLVPYIAWNVIYYVGYVIGSRLPWMNQVVGKGVIPLSLAELTEAILHFKYNPVFWYMYQLIFLILLAPVLYVVLKRAWASVIWFVVLAWMILAGAELPVVNSDALMYYSVAAKAALIVAKVRAQENASGAQDISHKKAHEKTWPVTGASMIVSAIIVYEAGLIQAVPACFVLCRLLAVGGLWLLIPGGRLPPATDIMRNYFFLYATHFAFVRLINKSAAMLLPHDPLVPLLLYLAMPGIVLGISVVADKGLRTCFPGLGIILNGGR